MRTKTSATLIACAFAAGSVMFSAPVASAAAYCDSSGYTATNEPMSRCTTLTNGILYAHQSSNDKISTQYSKTGGSSVSVRLGYSYRGSMHYSSYFSIDKGDTVTKQFSPGTGTYCQSMTGVLNYSGGTFQTPSTHC
ncbi:hypothetical protein ACFVW1_19235 [Streptomyces olivochromogenes]|uniref:hypothetical protein n=1 Tax=Streptomyces olivochromogenes TaxID=1963 RepID=UPI0036DA292B